MKNRILFVTTFLMTFMPTSVWGKTDEFGGGAVTTAAPSDAPPKDKEAMLDLIKSVTNELLTVAGFIFFIAILAGGILYITSNANPDRQTTARKTLTYAVIGFLIIVLGKVALTLWARLLGGNLTWE